jgi:hypothetical protein
MFTNEQHDKIWDVLQDLARDYPHPQDVDPIGDAINEIDAIINEVDPLTQLLEAGRQHVAGITPIVGELHYVVLPAVGQTSLNDPDADEWLLVGDTEIRQLDTTVINSLLETFWKIYEADEPDGYKKSRYRDWSDWYSDGNNRLKSFLESHGYTVSFASFQWSTL